MSNLEDIVNSLLNNEGIKGKLAKALEDIDNPKVQELLTTLNDYESGDADVIEVFTKLNETIDSLEE